MNKVASIIRATAHLDEIRQNLAQNLPWFHRDFMFKHAQFMQIERDIWAEQLTRSLPEANDLRFIYQGDNGQRLMILAELLTWDTQFFGYPIARLNLILPLDAPFSQPHADYSDAVATFMNHESVQKVKYLFASVFPEDLSTIRALGENKFNLIETRGYYHRSLTNYDFNKRFDVRLATPDDIEPLSKVAVMMANQYDRFHADPFIMSEDADRMMAQWVKASLTEGFADMVVVPDVDYPEAFCTVKSHNQYWADWGINLAQPVVLGAVSSTFSGWYSKLISEVCFLLKEMNASHGYIITQVTNRAAIRSFEKQGFNYGRGEHIFRIVQ